MDIRFACASVIASISGGGLFGDRTPSDDRSPYHLTGFACARVEDRYHPPDEWEYLSLAHIWTIERLPLRATVHAHSDGEWSRDMIVSEREWSASLLAAASKGIGDGSKEERSRAVTDAFNERLSKASAVIYYSAPRPNDEYARSRAARFDATLSIGLRVDAPDWQRWNNLWTHRHGTRVPACSVTVDNLRFSKSEANAAFSGIPTWSQFVAGEVMAPADMFTLRIAPTWEELAFTD